MRSLLHSCLRVLNGIRPKIALRIFVSGLTLALSITGASGQVDAVVTVIHNFSSGTGSAPSGLVQGSDRNFYGVAYSGGTNGAGALYKLTPAGDYSTIYNFADSDGSGPNSLLKGSDGNFYGETVVGGTNGTGTVFRYSLSGGLTTLYNFSATTPNPNEFDDPDVNADGAYVSGGLIQGTDGFLYGTTAGGGTYGYGTAFQVTTAGQFTVLSSFDSSFDGPRLLSGVSEGANQQFYCRTDPGPYGDEDAGYYFRIKGSGANSGYFFALDQHEGYSPNRLVEGSDGNLYGTASYGGANGTGTIFKLTSDSSLTVLHSFSALSSATAPNADGAKPQDAALIQGRDGNFYGTTTAGGASANGAVFRITPAGVFTTVHSLTNAEGSLTASSLLQASDGKFYGTSLQGGANNEGAVFALSLAPMITSATTATAMAENKFAFQITATNLPTKFTYVGGPGNFTITPSGLLSGTQAKVGTFKFSLTASNAFGVAEGTLTLTVKAALPVITSATTATASVDNPFFYQITATNHPTKYGESGLPTGLHIDQATGKISGKATTAGTYAVKIAAFNDMGTGAVALTLTVKAGAPIITSPASANSSVGNPFSYQITARNNPTKFGESGLPSGLTINQTTGLISGKPTKGGTYTVELAAFNAIGSGTATLTLTVKTGVPVVTSATSASASVEKAFAYQITATNHPTKYGESDLPAGLKIDQTTGKISGSPTKAGTFMVTIAAFNASGQGTAQLALTVK